MFHYSPIALFLRGNGLLSRDLLVILKSGVSMSALPPGVDMLRYPSMSPLAKSEIKGLSLKWQVQPEFSRIGVVVAAEKAMDEAPNPRKLA